jgi:peptide deformylase
MVREVLTFPHPMLKRVCESSPREFAESVAVDLIDTMRAHAGCVGIAAPQIGSPLRVAVVDVRQHRLTTSSNGLLVLVDPAIGERHGRQVGREGCLSLPDITADVERAARVVVASQLHGETWSEGFEARAIQHELDHLDGMLILDRVTSVHAVFPRQQAKEGRPGSPKR